MIMQKLAIRRLSYMLVGLALIVATAYSCGVILAFGLEGDHGECGGYAGKYFEYSEYICINDNAANIVPLDDDEYNSSVIDLDTREGTMIWAGLSIAVGAVAALFLLMYFAYKVGNRRAVGSLK